MADQETKKIEIEAYLYSRKAPTDQQKKRLQNFLEDQYHKSVEIIWKEDANAGNGFRIEAGPSIPGSKWT